MRVLAAKKICTISYTKARLEAKLIQRRMALGFTMSTNYGLNDNFCAVCQEGGQLYECDTCPRSYHGRCSDDDVDTQPAGQPWSCPHCVASLPIPNLAVHPTHPARLASLAHPNRHAHLAPPARHTPPNSLAARAPVRPPRLPRPNTSQSPNVPATTEPASPLFRSPTPSPALYHSQHEDNDHG